MRTIRINDRGAEVSRLKKLLNAYGYSVNDTDLFDEDTDGAVRKFQQAYGLPADGIAGFKTWELLLFSTKKAGDKLTYSDFILAASLLDEETACLKAVQKVETGGRGGFFAPGKPAILFEGHIFWRELEKRSINPDRYVSGNENILYKKWEKGHYKGGLKEYERLERALLIHEEAALCSASWGMFQIMGFNYKQCGENSVKTFVDAMKESEQRQLRLMTAFLNKNPKMIDCLVKLDWKGFSALYNGPSYAENGYDKKLKAAYAEYSSNR
ncbi:MAG: N-acetylmuramidase family protein [Rikenellaceae bacterium]|nr:N-acetylmuramidase family protein [Rikenellaceae bacterium]